MARTLEQIVRDYIGDQVLALAKQIADNEQLAEELAALKAAHPAPKPKATDERPRILGAV
jgi:hypothetical protein